ncbi:MAG: GatB/YqeY domain-containing protein [Candidatus Staskawiczbacteria bacterium]|nr:GatB/YqeY domain-containing protein [Candidatus Staskawiczbacteria bacterium]
MLKQDIQNDSKEALKSGDHFLLETLRMLLAGVLTKEKEKKFKEKSESEIQLSDEEIIGVAMSEIKKRRDASELYKRGKRLELAEKEEKEIEIIKKYLPEQLPTQEIAKLVEEAIAKTGAKEIKDMGKVMVELNPKIKGKADGSEVSRIVKNLLGRKN